MTKHRVYVTRDASVTYVAEVDLSLEEIEARCGKHGFDDTGLDIEWDTYSINTYDDAEAYQITHDVQKTINDQIVTDEVTDLEWELN